MTFETFVSTVDNLVAEWAHPTGLGSVIPREELKAIYDDVQEQGVHNLAETMRQRDEALRQLHGRIMDDGYEATRLKPKK